MNELALFGGAGGGILGGYLCGFRTVGAVEIEPYRREILLRRQRDGMLPLFPIWDDVCTFDGRLWRGLVDIITGGFPCQDISAAGKGEGITGSRSGLWTHMHRIIREVRPRYVLVENSPVLTSRGLGTVLGDLAASGYDARWDCIPACAAGAPHERDRIWVVANNTENGRREGRSRRSDTGCARQPKQPLHDVPDSNQERLEVGCVVRGHEATEQPAAQRGGSVSNANSSNEHGWNSDVQVGRFRIAREAAPILIGRGNQWGSEPALGRVAHGVANRVDRIGALGDGQVPAVVRAAWLLLGGDRA